MTRLYPNISIGHYLKNGMYFREKFILFIENSDTLGHFFYFICR